MTLAQKQSRYQDTKGQVSVSFGERLLFTTVSSVRSETWALARELMIEEG